MAKAARFNYGDEVIVSAQTVRVTGQTGDTGKPQFYNSVPSRDAGRHLRHDLTDAVDWPGEPVDLGSEPADNQAFHPEPVFVDGEAYVRWRRLLFRVPVVALVVGETQRKEGRLLAGSEGVTLAGPGRRLTLLEVALPPERGPARLCLVHPVDLAQVHRTRRTA